ncbi:hypothetical protein QJ850_gp502 [Acanthamoeba polyphaga mimivirus]|uniref:Uncharacterized protein n=1 Tax=Acanthamoeba polyphaga mimivirus Kroon TaxID=3069720 RepID=A0A0G2Y8Q1_9VIRU|nr:hypothetical protein QJ850_gp502 [Acanthamoeba polyphaga mimivirus]AKI80197.1 hypothetical protein [Acanthamoeba polyphaga mimivirus Kroon]
MNQSINQSINFPNHLPNNSSINNALKYLTKIIPNNKYPQQNQSRNNTTPIITNTINPIEQLTIEEITYLQKYLENIKNKKLNLNKQLNNQINKSQINSNRLPINSNRPQINNNNQPISKIQINKTNEIYDPLKREIPVDWGTLPINSQNNFRNNAFDANTFEPGSRGATSTRIGKKAQFNNPYDYGSKQNSFENVFQKPCNDPYVYDNNMLNQLNINEIPNNLRPNDLRNVDVESSLLQRESVHLPGQRNISEREFNRWNMLPFDPQDHRHIVWEDNMPRGGYATRAERLDDN